MISPAGSILLTDVLAASQSAKDIGEVYFNVQISNKEAVEFYQRHGFSITETKKDYYKNIEPRDCYVLSKAI
jgi:ribosomal protein S18 acetylase RimI-like enzyme